MNEQCGVSRNRFNDSRDCLGAQQRIQRMDALIDLQINLIAEPDQQRRIAEREDFGFIVVQRN